MPQPPQICFAHCQDANEAQYVSAWLEDHYPVHTFISHTNGEQDWWIDGCLMTNFNQWNAINAATDTIRRYRRTQCR